jgi:hypothetical protein
MTAVPTVGLLDFQGIGSNVRRRIFIEHFSLAGIMSLA